MDKRTEDMVGVVSVLRGHLALMLRETRAEVRVAYEFGGEPNWLALQWSADHADRIADQIALLEGVSA